MLQINSTIVINRPLAEVFAFTSNSNNDPLWWDGVISSKYGTEITQGVGTLYVQVNQYLGRTIDVSFETTEYEKDHLVGHRSVTGPMVFTTRMAYETIDEDATKMIFLAEVDVKGLFKLVQPIFNWMMSRRTDINLNRLKNVMETQSDLVTQHI